MSSAAFAETPVPSQTAGPSWNLAQRVGFRFAAVYLPLYLVTPTLHFYAFPGAEAISRAWDRLWNNLVTPVGHRIFHIQGAVAAGSVGDTAPALITILCFAVLAALVTMVWTLADRKAVSYSRIHDWLRMLLRYSLAVIIFSYGVDKIFPGQFHPLPSLYGWMSRFGDSSGFGLLWMMMGHSRLYTFFGGAVEVVGAALLFFRRTTTLGALILCGVLANVVMLNFGYGVPVKQFSSHLLFIAIFLALPDLPSLANVLVLRRPPQDSWARDDAYGKQTGTLVVKSLIIVSMIFIPTKNVLAELKKWDKPPLYGIWQVDEFVRNGEAAPPLLTDSDRWKQVIFDAGRGSTAFYIQRMNDSWDYYNEEFDEAHKTVTISDESLKSVSYTLASPEELALEGTFGNQALNIRLKKFDDSKLALNQKNTFLQQ